MKPDLLFHITTKRRWFENTSEGCYKPENVNKDFRIDLLRAENLKPLLNTKYKGYKHVTLIVIDTARIVPKLLSDDSNYYLNQPLNTDSVLDKIKLSSDAQGLFDIDVEA